MEALFSSLQFSKLDINMEPLTDAIKDAKPKEAETPQKVLCQRHFKSTERKKEQLEKQAERTNINRANETPEESKSEVKWRLKG